MCEWANQYYRFLLKPEEQKIYDCIMDEWNRFNPTALISKGNIKSEVINTIIVSIIKDHPEMFWINYYHYRIVQSFLKTEVKLKFFFDAWESCQLLAEANNWKKQVAGKIPPSSSEKEKLWLLFDYLARQVTYGKQRTGYSQTIIGPMSKHNHVSVCEGIAKSFKLLCDQVQIGCIVVFGDVDFGNGNAGPHAWNIVCCNGVYRHIDVTKELATAHRNGKASKTGFLFKDSEMGQYSWNKQLTPDCQ